MIFSWIDGIMCFGEEDQSSIKNFTILSLTFRALVYFELILVYDMKEGSNFTFSHGAVKLSQHRVS